MIEQALNWLGIKTYRIDHYPDIGYVPMRLTLLGWEVIEKDGARLGLISSAIGHPEFYFHATEEGAGQVINRHSMSHWRTTVWKG